jgi:predicted amidohydrolase
MSRAIRIAAAAAHFGRDMSQSIRRIGIVISAARNASADLLVLPHAALGGYLADLRSPDPDSLPPAILADSAPIRQIAEMAESMIVVFGYTEQREGLRWNSSVCVSGDGVLGHYRKVHQTPGEALRYAAGDRIAAFDTHLGRMGMLIDYDKTFPEAARTLALDDAQIVACPSAWPASVTQRAPRMARDRQSRLFDLYDQARAAENQLVWVSANQTGSFGGLQFLGQSKVVGPGGDVLARTWAKAGLAVAEIDVPSEIKRARLVLHHVTELRSDVYRTESRRA